MAPTTRSTCRQTPPSSKPKRRELNTVRKSRFYEAFDERHTSESTRPICQSEGISESTGRYLLKQRDMLGDKAYRRTRQKAEKLDGIEKVSHETNRMLISSENPVRDQPYEVQIEYYILPIKKRGLQAGLKRHIKGGRRFKTAVVEKIISPSNLVARVKYGEKYQDESIDI
jgi:hypothetical protein